MGGALTRFMRRVRAHAKKYSWRERGRVYSFCKFYQADLRQVHEYLKSLPPAPAPKAEASGMPAKVEASENATTEVLPTERLLVDDFEYGNATENGTVCES